MARYQDAALDLGMVVVLRERQFLLLLLHDTMEHLCRLCRQGKGWATAKARSLEGVARLGLFAAVRVRRCVRLCRTRLTVSLEECGASLSSGRTAASRILSSVAGTGNGGEDA